MGINDDNESPLNGFYVTSISKDEAVQKLLGWRISCTNSNGSSGDLSDEGQEGAGNASVTVLDVFEYQRTDLENALFEAKHPRLSEADIAEKEAALVEFDKKIDQAKRYLCAIDDELSKGDASSLRLDKNRQGNADPYITIHSFNEWVRTTRTIGIQPASPLIASTDLVAQPASYKPWLLHIQGDPPPEQPWYTPARYFARQLVIEDLTLLTKRDKLAGKVVPLLTSAHILKRGGKEPFDPGTVRKALSGIKLLLNSRTFAESSPEK